MLEKIKSALKEIHQALFEPHNSCYNQMEDAGIAVFGCCCGIMGGDSTTDYLACKCQDCPYLTIVK